MSVVSNKVMGKLSRPEAAHVFLSPAPEKIVETLEAQGAITGDQAALSRKIPMADAIRVEADSGGHTDGGVAYALTPAMTHPRDRMVEEHGYAKRVHVGEAAVFIQGADFILTGSINQCTMEAGTSDAATTRLTEKAKAAKRNADDPDKEGGVFKDSAFFVFKHRVPGKSKRIRLGSSFPFMAIPKKNHIIPHKSHSTDTLLRSIIHINPSTIEYILTPIRQLCLTKSPNEHKPWKVTVTFDFRAENTASGRRTVRRPGR